MRSHSTAIEALLPLINKLYEEIREIEAAHGLMASEGDFRPRIEYFHDAIRALTSGVEPYGKNTRLSVERLAYDLQFIRYIKETPLTRMHGAENLSPKTDVAVVRHGAKSRRPDRTTRERLSELYGNYAVLFSAMLKESADRNHKTRLEDMEFDMKTLVTLQQLLPKLEKGKEGIAALEAYASNVENDALRDFLMQVLYALKSGNKANIKEALRRIRELLGLTDRDMKTLEEAHFNFAASQLACYEDAKSLIKKLAGQGMNIAGKFLEGAIAEAQARGARER